MPLSVMLTNVNTCIMEKIIEFGVRQIYQKTASKDIRFIKVFFFLADSHFFNTTCGVP